MSAIPPTPSPLKKYWRDSTPDLEVAPREPVFAVGLVSPKGIPFVLVREALGRDHAGRMLAWLVWRGSACVGYVGTTTGGQDPFLIGSPLVSPRDVRVARAVSVWRSYVADGSGRGCGADVLARLPSRGMGIMWSAYVEIIRQTSAHGWALCSNPRARSASAKALWRRIHAVPSITVLRRRPEGGRVREFAIMLGHTAAHSPTGPSIGVPASCPR